MTVHHWDSITEAQKLTQSVLIPGVIDENMKQNPILGPLPGGQMPVAWSPGKSIKWNKANATMEDDVAFAAVGDATSWSNSITYTPMESELKIIYVQRILDTFVQETYGNVNDYEAVMLMEMQRDAFKKLNDRIFYADETYSAGTKEFDGLHAWAALQTPVTDTEGTNMDGESAGFNFNKMRLMRDAMNMDINCFMFPKAIGRRLSAAAYEVGLEVNGILTTRGQMSYLTFGVNDLGKRVMFWDGVPIILTDYLVPEEDGTGTGSSSNARAKYSSDKTYSIFGLRFGNLYKGDPGLMFAFGNTPSTGQMYEVTPFDKLEGFIGKGLRLHLFGAVLLGSKYGLCRMFDVDDAAALAAA